MKFTTISLALLAALVAANITAAPLEEEPNSRNTPLDFLADLPSLKSVFMRISEPAFLDLLKSQGLTYTHQTKDCETTYIVEVRKDAVIYFDFREGRCMSVQRSNGMTKG